MLVKNNPLIYLNILMNPPDLIDYNNIIDFFENNTVTPNNSFLEILQKMCFCKDNNVFFDYKIFKSIATIQTYETITKHFINITQDILIKCPIVNVIACFKSITFKELDKHREFIFKLIPYFTSEYPDKLNMCYLYKTPSIFSQLFSIVSIMIDKETRQKIKIINS